MALIKNKQDLDKFVIEKLEAVKPPQPAIQKIVELAKKIKQTGR